MFGKILGKSKEEASKDSNNNKIIEKIQTMNLTDMRYYVNNKLKDFELSEDGLNEVLRKINSVDANEKRFIDTDSMDTKLKKTFDLVIIIAKSKKITVTTLELIQEFMKIYDDLIQKFDKDNKQIYSSKLKDALSGAVNSLSTMSEVNEKIKVLGDN
jgi:hypothetical protein